MELPVVLGLAASGAVMYLSWTLCRPQARADHERGLRGFLSARADRRSPTGERGRS